MSGATVAPSPAAVGPAQLRSAFARLPAGVAVLLCDTPDGTVGATVSTLVCASLEPPLATVSLQRSSRLLRALKGGGPVGITVLAADQAEVARWFADPARPDGEELLHGRTVTRGAAGGLALAGGCAAITARPVAWVESGDHELAVLEVLEAEPGPDRDPLVHLGRRLTGVATA
ncbi:flavin reductase family protein [Kitasatospora xanthocidica]|uniref:flavin reductase family protein n=1 Tax=Kitasatospora xanthocidica TaxID=83382 RepID=UPI0036EB96C3